MAKSFRSNRLVAFNTGLTGVFFPPRLDILDDKVLLEKRKYLGITRDETSIGYHLISVIDIKGGLVWSTVVIETSGTASLSMFGLRRRGAREVKHLVDEKRVQARQSYEVPASKDRSDITDQIEKLAGLKEKGIISPEEFDAKKSDLLAKM